ASGRIQGQLDTPLDEVGRVQALAAAEVLAEAAPAVLLTSDLVRASDTARALADAVRVTPVHDRRLRELDLGAWQGLTSEQARERFPEEHRAWRAGRDVGRGGGETYLQAGERASACVSEHLPAVPPGGTLLAVTHGGTARAALGVLLELPQELWGRLAPLGNACWSVLVEGHRGWRLERHNTGLGPLVGAAPGALDLGSRAAGGAPLSPDAEPVR
ncbi:MAG: histidine phosphatase family protein, partial [Gemmatimonadetes bacterium]|nr:histidine phosphatase family protein [Gemmatimonadota bacterium]